MVVGMGNTNEAGFLDPTRNKALTFTGIPGDATDVLVVLRCQYHQKDAICY